MSPHLQAYAEQIIQFHKDNNGMLDWGSLQYFGGESGFFPTDMGSKERSDIKKIIRTNLLQMDLIIHENEQRTVLTEAGQSFTSFSDYLKNKRKASLTTERKNWRERNWILVSAITAVGSAFLGAFIVKIWPSDHPSPQTPIQSESSRPSIEAKKQNLQNNDTVSYNNFSKPTATDSNLKGQ